MLDPGGLHRLPDLVAGHVMTAYLSPVVVSPSLATAAMSPAVTSETGSCSLPRMSVS